jgi:ATP-dependent helicase HrpB
LKSNPPLPIDDVLAELLAQVRASNSVVLHAPTGAGKTTRVPPALLDMGIGHILVLEPRRLAARAAAVRIAHERGSALGEEVGYQVRFERRATRATRLLLVTPGILLHLLQDDPFLEKFAAVIFDEFHERNLEYDLAIGLLRLVQMTVRTELRLVVMSATLDATSVSTYLGHCPVVTSSGRTFPVEIRYSPPPDDRPGTIARAAQQLLDTTPGAVLVFLPGVGEIRGVQNELADFARNHDVEVLPLHGELAPEEQDRALRPNQRRKIVLATNVAETSVTVADVTAVLDTGLAREQQFEPGVGLNRLRKVQISRAAADQRAGRAGRTQPGVCVRLWSESAHLGRRPHTEPEILRVDLARAVLQLAAFGENDAIQFPWFTPPPPASVQQATTLLRLLFAVDDQGITSLGRQMARLPVHPRVARLLLAGQAAGIPQQAALAAALLTERTPFERLTVAQHTSESDLVDQVEALEHFAATCQGNLHVASAQLILRAAEQLERLLQHERPITSDNGDYVAQAPSRKLKSDKVGYVLQQILFTAFADRLCRRRAPGSDRGVMVGGRGVRLAPTSAVRQAELFVGIELDAGTNEILVRLASAVDRERLPSGPLSVTVAVLFDETTGKVNSVLQSRFADLLLSEQPTTLPRGAEVARVLVEAARRFPERVLPTGTDAAAAWRLRVQCLREWMPQLDLPALTDADLLDLLPQLADSCKSLTELQRADWLSVLRGQLSFQQSQAVEREAPERLAVPSGSQISLVYERGRPPVLAVRIQELFGLIDTPRIASGRVKVLLHLLAPNYRPQQVTDDLASFWANTYPQVRKDLRGRYPKHAWPDDPTTAIPQSRPTRKN